MLFKKIGSASHWISLSDGAVELANNIESEEYAELIRKHAESIKDLKIKIKCLSRFEVLELIAAEKELTEDSSPSDRLKQVRDNIMAGLADAKGFGVEFDKDTKESIVDIIIENSLDVIVGMLINQYQSLSGEEQAGFFMQEQE